MDLNGAQPFAEDDLQPISALQHLVFCERQCALIHLEGQWADNRLTIEGTRLHERADSAAGETRGTLRIARAIPLRSLRLGIAGRADIVEFHRQPGSEMRVVPVEYKRGRPKKGDEDRVQLCAQALCLEEMLRVEIGSGGLYYGETRHRLDVALDHHLRTITESTISRLHALLASTQSPKASRQPKCARCSLLKICMPDSMEPGRSASGYLSRALSESLAETSRWGAIGEAGE